MEENLEDVEDEKQAKPMRAVVVVDMQKDFITGSLGSPQAQDAVTAACSCLSDLGREAEGDGVALRGYVTMDTHDPDMYSESLEGHRLPVSHCVPGTPGHTLDSSLKACLTSLSDPIKVINKTSFGTPVLPLAIEADVQRLKSKLDRIDVMGLCTDICVISNVMLLRAAFPDTVIRVHACSCAGSTPEKHRHALDVMQSCMIDVVD